MVLIKKGKQMKVSVKKNFNIELVNEAAASTTHGKKVKAPINFWLRSEHSPVRLIRFLIKLTGVETFVSVHLTRHKIGVDHFVTSNRDDRGGDNKEDRNTPVNHSMDINAQALLFMGRRRLCYKSHKRTVATMQKIKSAVGASIPELEQYIVPECVYRNGICPEETQCKPGVDAVMSAYAHYPKLFKNRASI